MIGSARTIGTFSGTRFAGSMRCCSRSLPPSPSACFLSPRRRAGSPQSGAGLHATGDRHPRREESVRAIPPPQRSARLHRPAPRSGDLAGAVSLLEELLGEHPRDPDLLQALAGYYRQARPPRSCPFAWWSGSVHDPADAGSFQELARLYGELNRPIEQRRVLRQLVGRAASRCGAISSSSPRWRRHRQSCSRHRADSGGSKPFGPARSMRASLLSTCPCGLLSARSAGALERGERWLAKSRDRRLGTSFPWPALCPRAIRTSP